MLRDHLKVLAVRNEDSYNKGLSTVQANTATVPDKVIKIGKEEPFSYKSNSRFAEIETVTFVGMAF